MTQSVNSKTFTDRQAINEVGVRMRRNWKFQRENMSA
jgi:hypothetical protein